MRTPSEAALTLRACAGSARLGGMLGLSSCIAILADDVEQFRGPQTRDSDVPVESIREACLSYVHDHDGTWSDIARFLGWFCTRDGVERPDTARVRRTLGLHANDPRYHVRYETALRFAQALNLDPVDLDF